jgi:hypothetical protein
MRFDEKIMMYNCLAYFSYGMTLTLVDSILKLSINDSQHNDTQH